MDNSLAGMMSAALQDFKTTARWREDRSVNTFESAAFSAEILRQDGVPAAIVVTHQWHMARALWSFRAVGYPVIPAPVHGQWSFSVREYLPKVHALAQSTIALHELVGLGWYVWRYRVGSK